MQKCAVAFLLHITFRVLTCQIFSTEQLNAVLIGTRNGGSFAVKGQGRKVIGKAAEVGTAAVLQMLWVSMMQAIMLTGWHPAFLRIATRP